MKAPNPKAVLSLVQPQAARVRTQAGLSLVELMIAITVGLLLLAGLTTLIVQQSNARGELDKATRQIENGRYAMQLLREDIQLAGFYGEYWHLDTPPGTLPDPCVVAEATLKLAIPLPIQGYDSPSTVPSPLSACLPNANHVPGTDILVIRRADTETIPVGSAVAGQVYFQAGLTPTGQEFTYVLGTGSDTSVFTLTKKDKTTKADLHKYLVHIYFVSPCSVPTGAGGTCTNSDDNGQPIPTLKLLELTVAGGVAKFNLVPLVEGIENLQLDYGLDNSGSDGASDLYTNGTSYLNAAGTVHPMDTTDWSNVMSIRVNLLARNNERSVGYVDTKKYNLGLAGDTTPTNDTYKRHAFTQLVRVINPSSRRDK